MNASELRIGNLLEFMNGIEKPKIITVGRRFFSSASIEKEDGDFEITPYYRPIPITEEWLLEFGFEKVDMPLFGVRRFYGIGNFIVETLAVNEQPPNVAIYYTVSQELIAFKDYIHQLQNLYYSLTGEELTIKTESK